MLIFSGYYKLIRKEKSFNYRREYGKEEGKEVDFVIREWLKVKQLIQVTHASGRDEIEKRESRALVKASDLLNCKNLLIITWDYESEEEYKGKKDKIHATLEVAFKIV